MQKGAKKQLFLITLVVGLGFIGISLPYPIFAPMILNNIDNIVGSATAQIRVILLGVLLCAYPLGQFLGASVLGALSDSIGRKPSLSLSLTGAFIGYLISGLAVYHASYVVLLLSRVFTGLCEGNVAIAQAAAADMSPAIPKSTSFSMINASIAIAYIIGPLIGGIAVWIFHNAAIQFYALPFFIASALVAIALLMVVPFFEETSVSATAYFKENTLSILKTHLVRSICNIRDVMRIGSARYAIAVFLLFYISIDLFYEFYPLFFVRKWDLAPVQIGIFSAIYTLPYAISQGGLVPHISKRYKPADVLKMAGLASGLMLLILIIPKSEQSLYWSLPLLGVAMSFCSTNTAILVSDSPHQAMRGKVMGVAQSLRVLNIAIITIVGGLLGWIHFSMPLLVSGVVMLATLYLLVSSRNGSYGNPSG